MVCHIHPGTNMVTTYFGYTWWDNEIDGDKMYPAKQRHPSPRSSSRYKPGILSARQFAVFGQTSIFWSRLELQSSTRP